VSFYLFGCLYNELLCRSSVWPFTVTLATLPGPYTAYCHVEKHLIQKRQYDKLQWKIWFWLECVLFNDAVFYCGDIASAIDGWTSAERWWNDIEKAKPKYPDNYLSHFCFVHHKSHVGWRIADRRLTVITTKVPACFFVCLIVCIQLRLHLIEKLQYDRCTVPRLLSVTCSLFPFIGEIPLSPRTQK